MFIVSEAIRRKDDDEDDDDDDEGDIFGGKRDRYKDSEDDKFYRELAEKKRQTESLKEIADALPQPTPPAGLFSGRDGEEPAGAGAQEKPAFDDGMMELSHSGTPAEEPAAGKEEKPLGTGELPDVQAALEAALENQQLNRYEHPKASAAQTPDLAEVPDDAGIAGEAGEIELAMPVHTAEELMSKAYASGLEPKMRKDKSGVTLIDYSDCL